MSPSAGYQLYPFSKKERKKSSFLNCIFAKSERVSVLYIKLSMLFYIINSKIVDAATSALISSSMHSMHTAYQGRIVGLLALFWVTLYQCQWGVKPFSSANSAAFLRIRGLVKEMLLFQTIANPVMRVHPRSSQRNH